MAAATSEISAVFKPRMSPGWAANIQSSFICRRWQRSRSSCRDDSLVSLNLDRVVSKVRTDPYFFVVRDLYGVVHHYGANFGIIVSRGGFSRGAIDFARD